jgi:hypothetical protein
MTNTQQRRVLIGTPSKDGRLSMWYVHALQQTMKICAEKGITADHCFTEYEEEVQIALNEIIDIAIRGTYDDLIFIDSGMEWNPEWVLALLERSEHVVGGTARKKTDAIEQYEVKSTNIRAEKSGLIAVQSLGTAFVKISRQALLALWNMSVEYRNEGKTSRMVCSVEVADGQLLLSGSVLSLKLANLGFQSWLDPRMTCVHIGSKKFEGNVADFITRLLAAEALKKEQARNARKRPAKRSPNKHKKK